MEWRPKMVRGSDPGTNSGRFKLWIRTTLLHDVLPGLAWFMTDALRQGK